MTKALVRYSRRHPAKQHTKHVKGHAGRNGEHAGGCPGWFFGTHCSAIITSEDRDEPAWRIGKKCGFCLTIYGGFRGFRDVLLGPVCDKHFKREVRKRAAARRRRW
jgi:hypothetical protein